MTQNVALIRAELYSKFYNYVLQFSIDINFSLNSKTERHFI